MNRKQGTFFVLALLIIDIVFGYLAHKSQFVQATFEMLAAFAFASTLLAMTGSNMLFKQESLKKNQVKSLSYVHGTIIAGLTIFGSSYTAFNHLELAYRPWEFEVFWLASVILFLIGGIVSSLCIDEGLEDSDNRLGLSRSGEIMLFNAFAPHIFVIINPGSFGYVIWFCLAVFFLHLAFRPSRK